MSAGGLSSAIFSRRDRVAASDSGEISRKAPVAVTLGVDLKRNGESLAGRKGVDHRFRRVDHGVAALRIGHGDHRLPRRHGLADLGGRSR